jgi:hypothetical protein
MMVLVPSAQLPLSGKRFLNSSSATWLLQEPASSVRELSRRSRTHLSSRVKYALQSLSTDAYLHHPLGLKRPCENLKTRFWPDCRRHSANDPLGGDVGLSRRSAGRITPHKSLAPYRDCLGSEFTGMMRCLGRGSFDRDDLKEAAGAAVRAPSYGAASLLFLGFGMATSVTRRRARRNGRF